MIDAFMHTSVYTYLSITAVSWKKGIVFDFWQRGKETEKDVLQSIGWDFGD